MMAFRWLKSMLFAPRQPEAPFFDAPLAPAEPLAVIGDVHGRADLFRSILERLDGFDGQLVQVGDLVDRGEASRDVLETARARAGLVCLMGNHERMMLDFIDAPDLAGRRWLRNGGLQTLASFGVGGLTENAEGTALIAARDALRDAMGAEMLSWLETRPMMFRSGNIAVVHAMTDPAFPIDGQDAQTLLWARPARFATARTDGIWTVHGHTIVEAAKADMGRIAVDTGAYATGTLTAAIIRPGEELSFVTA